MAVWHRPVYLRLWFSVATGITGQNKVDRLKSGGYVQNQHTPKPDSYNHDPYSRCSFQPTHSRPIRGWDFRESYQHGGVY